MKKLLLLCLLGIMCLGLMACDSSAEEERKSAIVIETVDVDLDNLEEVAEESSNDKVTIKTGDRAANIKEKASDVDPKKVAEALGLDEDGQIRYEELKADGLTAKEIISQMQEEGYDIELPKGRE